jgi:large subunit ribosomal protein L1
MAKKPTAPEETDPAAKPKKKSEPKAADKEPRDKHPRSKEPKEAAAKQARAKPKEAKATPEAPARDMPSTPAQAPASIAGTEPSTKRRGKRPGVAPPRGKKLRTLLRGHQQKLLKDGPVPLRSAIDFLKEIKRSKFDETVEIHMALGIDASQNDQMVRGTVPLPHGLGKSVRVVVFCQGDNVAKAKEAGGDHAGSDDLIKKIQQENWLDFDVALATQDMMGAVSRLGKVLGPRGLMPTPKSGTVITAGSDVGAAVREFKAGKVEYRADKGGNVHAGVGKLSFDADKLAQNVTTFVEQIRAVKPAGVKGHYIKSVTLTATMSPGIPVLV